ncbi:MAG: PAS domain S-box protein [Desulfobulbaceae bacterium]|nr:PAS domain S-box protein [Desulfobulbaceae bacterium]
MNSPLRKTMFEDMKGQAPDNGHLPELHLLDTERQANKPLVCQADVKVQNTQLHASHEHLSELLNKYFDLYESAPVGHVTTDNQGLIVETNLTFATLLGIKRHLLVNTAIHLHITGPDQAMLRAHLSQVFQSNRQQSCELHLKCKDSSKRYVLMNSVRVNHADGRQFCQTTVTDLTARKGAEAELSKLQRELEERVKERSAVILARNKKFKRLFQEFKTLILAISDTLILLSPDMEVLWMNGRGTARDNEEPNSAWQYCYQMLHAPHTYQEDWPARRCLKTKQMESAITHFNGSTLDVRAFPVLEEGLVNSVLLLVSDISEKMMLQAEAIQAAHLASLGELVAGVAHEINNPITGIINYGQILSNEGRPDSLEKDIGKRIIKEGERVGRIVKSLLFYARHDRQETKTFISIPTILHESIILSQAQIRKEAIELEISLPDDLPLIDANSQQIQQCMINIINNSRYALNQKYLDRHANKRLVIAGECVTIEDNPYVRIVFHDQGVGIAAQEIPALTKPFYSTKPYGTGTGLGLSITQKIIEDHGGHLSFESVEGEYTKVIIDLPIPQSDTEAA